MRFSINPFLPIDEVGFNSYASKPAGEGLSVFLELGIELAGSVDPATGLVVNVSDIDKRVRDYAIPLFAERIRTGFGQCSHIGYDGLAELLKAAWGKLADKFETATLNRLCLKIDPFRILAIEDMDGDMVYYSEKFEFVAAHKLWNPKFSKKQNNEVFGKCANPAGHGHNYTVEVTVKYPAGQGFKTGDFEKIVYEKLIQQVDHKNLNEDMPEFGQINPTVENITLFAWNKLSSKFGNVTLHCVTVWESDKTYSSYYG